MSHESIVNRQIKCTQNLPFEVIAVPQYNDSQLANNAGNYLTEPINIKIRIQNKEEVGKHGTISFPKLPSKSARKVRLIRSDQTIISFDLLMEPEINKKNQKKSQKNIFHIFRPGMYVMYFLILSSKISPLTIFDIDRRLFKIAKR